MRRLMITFAAAVAVTLASAGTAWADTGSGAAQSTAQPTFVTSTVDDTVFYPQTSAICGFPFYEHDTGTVTTMITTLPDGSVKSHDIVVKITVTFYSTDPAHTGTVTTRAAGPFIEIDHPDGTVTAMGIGQDGHVTMPGQGLVWGEIGITKIEVDATGNVTEIQHGIFSPNHSGICPLL
jgi:hypothetical protein